jgi:RNA polymerase sigma-70 factor, ECF subfamily
MDRSPRDYEDVYARTYGRLVGQLTVITGNPQEAQDAVQEALFRAWLRWSRISRYQDPEGWIRRVAINVATSRWRRIRRIVPLPTESESRDDPRIDLIPEVLALLGTMAQVPRRERQALVLFYLADLSVQEVADSMSIRMGTAKALLSRGRQHLSLLLAEGEQPFQESHEQEPEEKGRTHVR